MADVKPLILDSGIIKQMGSGDTLPVANGGTGSTTLPVVAKSKLADETVTSSNTLQDDDHLFFPIGANETWAFNMVLSVSANASGGLKYLFTVPSGATATAKIAGSANPFASAINTDLTAGNGTTNSILNTQSQLIYGTVVNGSNAGTVQLRWAQNASFGTGTTINKNSNLLAIRIS